MQQLQVQKGGEPLCLQGVDKRLTQQMLSDPLIRPTTRLVLVNESCRIHLAVGLLLERVVPLQGATICGELIPGGTIFGCNAWVLHQNKQVFGDDAHIYRPERWLESEGADPARIAKMKSSIFHFGPGARTCIGRNISLMKTYKLVPSSLRKFELETVESEGPMYLKNAFFVARKNFKVRVKPRHGVSS